MVILDKCRSRQELAKNEIEHEYGDRTVVNAIEELRGYCCNNEELYVVADLA